MEVNSVSLDSLKEESIFVLGCSEIGAKVLEETKMEPFFTKKVYVMSRVRNFDNKLKSFLKKCIIMYV